MIIWFLLPIILYLGIMTSLTDIRDGKIKNIHLITMFCIGLAIYIIFSILTKNIYLILNQSIYGLVGIFGGCFFWFFGLWSAGDAKLFSVYAFLMPWQTYKNSLFNFYPPIELLIYTFIPLTIVLVIQIILTTSKKDKIEALKNTFSPKRLAISLFTVFSLAWIMRIVLGYFSIPTNFITTTLAITLVSILIDSVWNKKEKYYLYALCAIFHIYLNYKMILTKNYLFSLLIMILIYSTIISWIREQSDIFVKEVSVNNLKEGMISAEVIEKTNVHINKNNLTYTLKKKRMGRFEFLKQTKTSFLFPLQTEGLTKIDIEKIKEYGIKSLKINQKIPFGPYLCTGMILAMLQIIISM